MTPRKNRRFIDFLVKHPARNYALLSTEPALLADHDSYSMKSGNVTFDFYKTSATTHLPLYGQNGNVWFTDGGSVGEFIVASKTIKECPQTAGLAQELINGPNGGLWFGLIGINAIGYSDMNCDVKTFATAGWTTDLVLGTNGLIYFSDKANKIGSVTTNGDVKEFPTSYSTLDPIVGPNGNIWFGEFGPKVGMLNVANGKVTEWEVKAAVMTGSLLKRSDGSVWFGTDLAIGKITPDGKVVNYDIPGNAGASFLMEGPDGNVWFGCQYSNNVGKVDSKGQVSLYPVSGLPMGMVFGPGNRLFVGMTSYSLAIVSLDGTVEEKALTGAIPYAPHIGPDGNVWFPGNPWQSVGVSPFIGRYTVAGELTEFKTSAYPNSFLNGTDGNTIYMGMSTYRFGVINLG